MNLRTETDAKMSETGQKTESKPKQKRSPNRYPRLYATSENIE